MVIQSPGYRIFIFDLDGTLADTAGITNSRRTPYDVLRLVPPGGGTSSISFGPEVCSLPGRLIEAGALVYIVTRSPVAYASTLTALLDLDYDKGFASIQNGYESHQDALHALFRSIIPNDVDLGEVIYIGDKKSDMEAALSFGIHFAWAEWNDHRDYWEKNQAETRVRSSAIFTDLWNYKTVRPHKKSWDERSQYSYHDLLGGASLSRSEQSGIVHDSIPSRADLPHFGDRSIWGIRFERALPTWNRINETAAVRKRILQDLQRLFVPQKVKVEGVGQVGVFHGFRQSGLYGNDYYLNAKHWQGTHSGPEPRLGFLNFAAIVMSSSIQHFGNENLIHPRYEHLSNQLSTDFWELCEPIMPNPDEDSMIQLLTSQLGEVGIGDSPIFGFVEEPFNDTKSHYWCPTCGQTERPVRTFKSFFENIGDTAIDFEGLFYNYLGIGFPISETEYVNYLFRCQDCGTIFDIEKGFDEEFGGEEATDEAKYNYLSYIKANESGIRAEESRAILRYQRLKAYFDRPCNSLWGQTFLDALLKDYRPKTFIVPVPSSNCSIDRPAQFSERLAKKIADYTGFVFSNVLIKRTSESGVEQIVYEGNDSWNEDLTNADSQIILIDDQLTHGRKLKGASLALQRAGIKAQNIKSFVWTISTIHHKDNPANFEAMQNLTISGELDDRLFP